MKKQKWSYYLEATIYIIFLYIINACVFLNCDDFMYGAFSKGSILQNVSSYYVTGNGRFWINILDSILLSFDRYLFIVINPLITMLFLILLAKNVQWITEKKADHRKEWKYFRYSMVLFACLDVMCLRETVFWITGMMNYLFPAMLFLLAMWMFQQAHQSNGAATPKRIVYWIICFLAGSSVEQYALMFIGIMTLILVCDFFRRRKVSSCLIVGYIIALTGLATLILAPGNFVRVNTQNKLMPPFIDNLWTLIYQNTMSPVAFPYLLMLSLCVSGYIRENSQSKIIRMNSMVVPALMLAIRCIPEIEKMILIVCLLASIIVQLTYVFVFQKYSGKKEILALIFVGLGSQLMLLISAIWGFRCMFAMYVVYMLLILYYLPQLDTEERLFVLCSGIIGHLCPIALALLWILRILLKNKKKIMISGYNILVHTSVIAALLILFLGYARNVPVHLQNLKQTTENSDSGELHLEALPDETYSWYFIPMGEFHEEYYKIYHTISDSVEIIYENVREVK